MGPKVFIQNQRGAGKLAKRWDRTGTVVEDKNHDKYSVEVDGSGRLADGNRRYLRAFKPDTQTTLPAPRTLSPPPITPHEQGQEDDVARQPAGAQQFLNLEQSNMMVRTTLSHTSPPTGPCRTTEHHDSRSLKL